ncbi:MAG: S26 family signal peptidase [Methanosarcinaceae archaeon]|nr:S26 family signal peptidase [Methanosarcinaceae archaeon]MDD4497268.1 S26 family signal peptidase [Methanosarcinaceae archaeon]
MTSTNLKSKNHSNIQEEDSFLVSLGKDLLSVVAFLLAFIILSKMAFGLWTPMVAVESGSMEPHMQKGDIIFIKNIDRVDLITNKEGNENSGYMSFGEYGNVILYKPYGQEGVTPIIHRAMYRVETGEPMWENGPAAPHPGYITKGDNPVTNNHFDQEGMISYNTPIKDEWIIGIAKYRIPYLGHIRLLFSGK